MRNLMSTELKKWSSVILSLFITIVAKGEEPYEPPKSPPLYAEEKPTVPKLRSKAGLFLGGSLDYGQVSEGKLGSGPLYRTVATIGYFQNLGMWSRFEPSLQLFVGRASFSSADVDQRYGFLVRVGYGRALGSGLWGHFHGGIGLTNNLYDFKGSSDERAYKQTSTKLGSIFELSYELQLYINELWSILGGVSYSQNLVNIGEVEYRDGTKARLNESRTITGTMAKIAFRYAL